MALEQVLASVEVLILRPQQQSREAAVHFTARGATVTSIPVIDTVPLVHEPAVVAAAQSLVANQWVVFTSDNGVRAFADEAARQGQSSVLSACRIATIGPKTAAIARNLGLRVQLVSERYVAADFARALARQLAPGEPVLIAAARLARPELPNALRATGYAVNSVSVYDTVTCTEAAPALHDYFAKHSPNKRLAVVFSSSSMVTAFIEVVGDQAVASLHCCCVCAIGPITAATLVDAGAAPDVVAAVFTFEGVAEALAAYLG